MTEQEITGQEVKTIKQEAFPEELERRIEAILASFNASPKAVTLLLLGEGMIDPVSLDQKFRETLAGSEMARTHRSTVPDYCHRTLCPIGLVAKEFILDDFGAEKLAGFSLTPAGKKYGQPLAAFSLKFEKEHGFSLFPILGSTQSTGRHRSPFYRTRILKALMEGEKREIDLLRKLETVPTKHHLRLGPALNALKEAGVIEYSSVKSATGREQVSYKIAEKGREPLEIRPVRKLKTLTQEVARISQELAEKGEQIAQANISANLPEERKKRWQDKELRHSISGILSDLVRQGFLKRGRYKGSEVQSSAALTEKGKLVVREFLLPLEEALADGPILVRLRKEVLPQVLGNLPFYARETANFYYPHSMGFKRRETEERKERLLSLLQQAGEKGLTTQDLAQELGVDRVTVRDYLKALRENGQARREKRKSVWYFYPRRKI